MKKSGKKPEQAIKSDETHLSILHFIFVEYENDVFFFSLNKQPVPFVIHFKRDFEFYFFFLSLSYFIWFHSVIISFVIPE